MYHSCSGLALALCCSGSGWNLSFPDLLLLLLASSHGVGSSMASFNKEACQVLTWGTKLQWWVLHHRIMDNVHKSHFLLHLSCFSLHTLLSADWVCCFLWGCGSGQEVTYPSQVWLLDLCLGVSRGLTWLQVFCVILWFVQDLPGETSHISKKKMKWAARLTP